MHGDDEDLKSGLDDFKKAARINFRDYPSTALVVVGALSSGLAWMLYKWLDRKRAPQRVGPTTDEAAGPARQQAAPSDDSQP